MAVEYPRQATAWKTLPAHMTAQPRRKKPKPEQQPPQPSLFNDRRDEKK